MKAEARDSAQPGAVIGKVTSFVDSVAAFSRGKTRRYLIGILVMIVIGYFHRASQSSESAYDENSGMASAVASSSPIIEEMHHRHNATQFWRNLTSPLKY